MPSATHLKIAVGMSGGIDSSVAAARLVDEGHTVVGLTAHMWREGSRCCSIEDVRRARRVADRLGIEHYVLNAQAAFTEAVVEPFLDEYERGRTPSPCITCNQRVKFGFLLTRAVQFGCDALATGHYARLRKDGGGFHLLCAKDDTRDQSYFLHRLSQRQLAHVCLPLGDLLKQADVAPFAREHGLPMRSRGESRDLCFVSDRDYGRFVEAHRPDVKRRGPIRDPDGRRIGEHGGIHRYTVGQRRGLGIAAGSPRYVTRIDREDNAVHVGTRSDAMQDACRLSDVHWIANRPPSFDCDYEVRLRYRHRGARARLHPLDNGTVEVAFVSPQFAVTPGQAGVVYHDDEVLGGGWIETDFA